MKRTFMLLTAGVFAASAALAQNDTLLFEDFEGGDQIPYILVGAPNGNDGPNWINFDEDGLAVEGGFAQEWLSSFGFSTADENNLVYASRSWLVGFAPGNRNWLISPRIYIGDATAKLSWYSASYQTPLYLDGYQVLVSTSGNLESNFTNVLFNASQYLGSGSGQSVPSPVPVFNNYSYSSGWVHGYDGTSIEFDTDSTRFLGVLHQHEVSLAQFNGNWIHIAFLHNSDDDNWLSIDEILVTGNDYSSVVENELKSSITIFPNPATEFVTVEYELSKTSSVVVTITDINGKIISQEARGNQMAGTHRFTQDVTRLAVGTYNMIIEAYGTQTAKQFIVQ
jgi:hypothetical protein